MANCKNFYKSINVFQENVDIYYEVPYSHNFLRGV